MSKSELKSNPISLWLDHSFNERDLVVHISFSDDIFIRNAQPGLTVLFMI